MATYARDRCPNVMMVGDTCVTVLAVQRRVFANERESCELMSLHHVRDLPRLVGVTSGTVGAELRFVNVRVTRRAPLTCGSKFEPFVATSAFDSPVLTLEDEPRFVVVEFCIGPHAPRIRGVARFAGNFDVTVR